MMKNGYKSLYSRAISYLKAFCVVKRKHVVHHVIRQNLTGAETVREEGRGRTSSEQLVTYSKVQLI